MGTFNMPSLGADMAAGTLVEWLKQPGDALQKGDIVAVVETEKGAIEVEIFESGRLDRLLVQPGTKVPVGTALAVVAGEGEAVSEAPAPPSLAPPAEVSVPASPAVTKLAVPIDRGRPRASPAARRFAREHGIELAGITGHGPAGSVVLEDVTAKQAGAPRRIGLDLDQMRHAIAAAMAHSKREIPHYYLMHSFDVAATQGWLERYNAERVPQDRLLIAPLLLKVVAVALRDFPEFNGYYGSDGFRPSTPVHVGTAVAIRGGGLAAPAIHDTDQLSLADLMARLRDLIARVRRGGFRSSELSDATITVSSLGERGVETLFPIIYPPQVAIVGFGAVALRPWVVEGHVEARPVLTASLAGDHRVSDGHRGALFLQRIETLLGRPETL